LGFGKLTPFWSAEPELRFMAKTVLKSVHPGPSKWQTGLGTCGAVRFIRKLHKLFYAVFPLEPTTLPRADTQR
jgi:hypothetical protein